MYIEKTSVTVYKTDIYAIKDFKLWVVVSSRMKRNSYLSLIILFCNKNYPVFIQVVAFRKCLYWLLSERMWQLCYMKT